ncbi:unnamed protein product [Hermetia illucens]|uniref:C2H2-type domain-containing protein n=3 Tax=Hermetia illucens TaxID=343691 RepID=A0A7R8UTK5_HERIL|nr:unnamed protein product [Hermetia illucens]
MDNASQSTNRQPDEVLVKEEFDVEDIQEAKTPLKSEGNQMILASPDAKCGEVFLGCKGSFTFVCSICSNYFADLEVFGTHIRDLHLKFNTELGGNAGENRIVESIRQDPLSHSPFMGKPCTEEVLLTSTPMEDENGEEPKVENSKIAYTNGERNLEAEDRNSQTPDEAKTFISCRLCGKTYIHHRSYLAHARKVHGILTKRMRNKLRREARKSSQDTVVSPEVQENQEGNSVQNENDDSVMAEKEKFSCALCNRSYKYRRSLRFHVRTDHGDEALSLIPRPKPVEDLKPIDSIYEEDGESSPLEPEEDHPCNLCNRIYRHKRSLRFHIKNDHGEEALGPPQSETICKYCDKEFNDEDTLDIHIESDHPGDKKYVCPHCSRAFKCRATRQEHINTHTGERPYKCPHCSKGFSNSSNLAVHIRMHLQIKNHSCSFCGKRFVSSSEKKRHERTHTGEKLHQCEECGKQYASLHKLNDHLKRHKNIKNFKCDVCSKTFYTLHMLKDHKSAHSSERPFSCDICGQRFPRRRALRVHEQLHSDVKKYVCNTCGKAFAQCAGLYSHRKSHGEIK